MNKVLIIGGTAGIGEQFVRRFHSLGKKVIATGRNGEKLESLKKELEGLETSKVGCSLGHTSGTRTSTNLSLGTYSSIFPISQTCQKM